MDNLNEKTFDQLPLELKEKILDYVNDYCYPIISFSEEEFAFSDSEEEEENNQLVEDCDISKYNYILSCVCREFYHIIKRLRTSNKKMKTPTYISLHNLSMLKWCRSQGCPWHKDTCVRSAARGNLELLRFVRTQNPPAPWTDDVLSEAARNGQLEILQWAHANNYPWDSSVCAGAAEFGYLDILQWLRNNGCPWNPETCFKAASGGHLNVLKWAHDNGCPWNKYTSMGAIIGHCPDILKWLHDNGCPSYDMNLPKSITI